MGYLIDNTGHGALRTWSHGNDGGEVWEFTLPEPDRRTFADRLAALDGSRVLVVTREWSEDGEPEQTRTEVVAGVSPVYVANLLAYWGITYSDDGGEHYASDGEDNHYVAGYGRPVAIFARYTARLIGFSPLELAAIYGAIGANGSDPDRAWRSASPVRS